jgi:hypothetical protein
VKMALAVFLEQLATPAGTVIQALRATPGLLAKLDLSAPLVTEVRLARTVVTALRAREVSQELLVPLVHPVLWAVKD